ncbi:AGE family epimerase/isomerase [Vibrio gangliei]|uniref:AGE family epimerase/isomerase n=1 Tax=Vibrio gangliei TaxID=2077090 RepID=UPI000D011B08|nr:AGE family epimerase/isomerase [Vibrio gangliei]
MLDLNKLKKEFQLEAENILTFWAALKDDSNGGFYSESYRGKVDKNADKSVLLHCRILWAFSSAYKVFKREEYKQLAAHAYQFLAQNAFDEAHDGLVWMLDKNGNVTNYLKHTYNQAFGIYALSEYYAAVGDEEALELAKRIFHLIERKALDSVLGGYNDAFQRHWVSCENHLLGDVGMFFKFAPKTMNTHLHVLEAYSNLAKCWSCESLLSAIERIASVFERRIYRVNGHLGLYFSSDWKLISPRDHETAESYDVISYGHEIEASWLLDEALDHLPASPWKEELIAKNYQLATLTYEHALAEAGFVFNEWKSHIGIDLNRVWWVQAEALVGFMNAYQVSHESKWINAMAKCWHAITQHQIDKVNGEWFWSIDQNNRPQWQFPQVSTWKCPYHNTRACLELYQRISQLEQNEKE